jgi:hypothetical protein
MPDGLLSALGWFAYNHDLKIEILCSEPLFFAQLLTSPVQFRLGSRNLKLLPI